MRQRILLKEQIEKLEQEINFLIDKNREIRENSYADGISVLRQLREGLLIVENMTFSREKCNSLVILMHYLEALLLDYVKNIV